MLKDGELMAFLATAKPEQAKDFYAGVLGLPLVADEPFALVFDLRGTMLRIQKAEKVSPAPYTALGWRVPRIADVVQALAGKGVPLVRYPHMEQDERGVWTAPSEALVAWFEDPDGNLLSLTQFA